MTTRIHGKNLWRLTTALAAGTLATAAFAQEVTHQRLVNADKEPQNWLLPYGTYDARNHSALKEINKVTFVE